MKNKVSVTIRREDEDIATLRGKIGIVCNIPEAGSEETAQMVISTSDEELTEDNYIDIMINFFLESFGQHENKWAEETLLRMIRSFEPEEEEQHDAN